MSVSRNIAAQLVGRSPGMLALQHEIQRAHEAVAESDSREGKSPGWVRLGFPVVASMLLWTVIIGFIRMLG